MDELQVIAVSTSVESLRIKVGNRELEEGSHFKYPGSVSTRDDYYTREIKMRIAIYKEEYSKTSHY
jgi:hypothetical protein